MKGYEISVYATVEELTGTAPTEEEFLNGLTRFSLYSVLRTCSLLGLLLEIWKLGADAKSTQQQLYYDFFPTAIAAQLTALLWAVPEQRRFLLHRRQLLLIQKYAIAHCSSAGQDALANKNFGAVLLAANDLLGKGPALSGIIATPQQAAEYIVLMLVVSEYSTHRPAQNIARARQLLLEIPKELGFFELAAKPFETSTGLSLEKYLSLFIASMAPFFKYNGAQWASRVGESFLTAAGLKAEGTNPTEIRAFLNFVAASPPYLRRRYAANLALPADFSSLRDAPLIELVVNVGRLDQFAMFVPTDVEFMMDKLLSGPFWEIRRSVPNFESKCWGKVFESYVSRLLTRTAAGTNMQLACNPKYESSPSSEVCDAVVLAGDTLVLIEVKTCMMNSTAKYSDSGSAMNESLQKLLIGTQQKPKAVLQIANAIRSLFSRTAPRSIAGLSLEGVKRCFGLVVTLDHIGSSPGVAMYVNMHLEQVLQVSDLSVVCEGGFSVGIEELEFMTGFSRITR